MHIRTQCFWNLHCAATLQIVEVQPDASEDPLVIRRKPGTKRVGVEWYGSVDGDSNGRALFIKRKSHGVGKNTFAGSISKVMKSNESNGAHTLLLRITLHQFHQLL